MGKGIDDAREGAPEHAALLDDFKDDLLVALIRRMGGSVRIPVAEVDDVGGLGLAMAVRDGVFIFEIVRKQ